MLPIVLASLLFQNQNGLKPQLAHQTQGQGSGFGVLHEGNPVRWDIWAEVWNSSSGNRCPLKLTVFFGDTLAPAIQAQNTRI